MLALACASIDEAALDIIWDLVNLAVSSAKSASSIFESLVFDAISTFDNTLILNSALFSEDPNLPLVWAIVSIAVSILVNADVAFELEDRNKMVSIIDVIDEENKDGILLPEE